MSVIVVVVDFPIEHNLIRATVPKWRILLSVGNFMNFVPQFYLKVSICCRTTTTNVLHFKANQKLYTSLYGAPNSSVTQILLLFSLREKKYGLVSWFSFEKIKSRTPPDPIRHYHTPHALTTVHYRNHDEKSS